MGKIDNFELVGGYLTFESKFDRYVVHVIKRAKDERGRKYGSNETNRLIKTFYITSAEYFERKIPVIKDLCDSNGARAYILPQVRSNEDCLKELLKITVDNLSNPTIKPDHLIRSAYCGMHSSRCRKWVIDLDSDSMFGWKAEDVERLVEEKLTKVGKSGEWYSVPTKNGMHIVTSPFDLLDAQKDCEMMFEGVRKMSVGVKHVGPGETEEIIKDTCGWLHKDGMTLLYAN